MSDDDVIETEINVSRIEKRAIKQFSIALMAQAEQCSWEDHELARLVLLISKQRSLSSKKTLKFMAECNLCKPIVLALLRDEGLTFIASSIIHTMHEHAGHADRFIDMINEGFEQGILSTNDDESIQALHEIGTESMNTNQYRRLTRTICDHTARKKVCGRVLHVLVGHMQTAEAASFICDVISFDFFLDLTGTMKGFLAALPGDTSHFTTRYLTSDYASLLTHAYLLPLPYLLLSTIDETLADRVKSLVAETRHTDENGKHIIPVFANKPL